MTNNVRKLAEFVEFMAYFNEYYGKGGNISDPSGKRSSRLKKNLFTSTFENDENCIFSCGEELPPCSLTDYLINVYTLLGLEEEAIVLCPFAYISKLHNWGELHVTRWNMHR